MFVPPPMPYIFQQIWGIKSIHTLCVHYMHTAANLNSGYQKNSKKRAWIIFCTTTLRTPYARVA